MKKIIFLLAVIMLFFTGIPAYAEDYSVMNYAKVNNTLMEHSREIKRLEKTKKDALDKYQQAEMSAKDLDTEGVTFTFNNQKAFFEYDAEVKVMMMEKKELVPLQTEYDWQTASRNVDISKMNLSIQLREKYLDVVKAFNQLDIKKKRCEWINKKNETDKKEFQLGVISQEDLDGSNYQKLVDQKDLEAAQRNWKNACRSLNIFLGLPIDTVYNEVQCEEEADGINPNGLNSYIGMAVQQRKEILDLAAQTKLKELEMDIIQRNDMNKKIKRLAEDYESGTREIEEMKFKQVKAGYDIEFEIRNAFTDLLKERNILTNAYNSLQTKRAMLKETRAKFNQNLISQEIMDDAEISGIEAENNYKQSVYAYNTKVMEFKDAVGLGPAYQKGAV